MSDEAIKESAGKPPETATDGRDSMGRFDGTVPGPGRPKGSANVATAQAREAFEAFVTNNTQKMQALFDRVAVDDPDKALDLLAKLAEFVLPKLARTETTLSGDSERPPALVIKRAR